MHFENISCATFSCPEETEKQNSVAVGNACEKIHDPIMLSGNPMCTSTGLKRKRPVTVSPFESMDTHEMRKAEIDRGRPSLRSRSPMDTATTYYPEKNNHKIKNMDVSSSDAAKVNFAASVLCNIKYSFTSDYGIVDMEPFDVEHNSHRKRLETCRNLVILSPSQKNNVPTHKNRPARLTMPEDSDELNSLHCFVRSELLEIFYVSDEFSGGKSSNTADSSLQDDSNTSSDNTEESSIYSSDDNSVGMEKYPRRSCRILESASGPNISITTPISRLFPGRVGLRCVYCAPNALPEDQNICERVGKASMSAFYPKSIEDLYRSVCTWQRVHFQACHRIPSVVRDKYWSLKHNDLTRGKTRYWITSARDLGLQNAIGNHDGRIGVVFVSND